MPKRSQKRPHIIQRQTTDPRDCSTYATATKDQIPEGQSMRSPITLLDATCFIELDDGKILTGKPDQFDGKNPWVSGVDFPNKTNPLI